MKHALVVLAILLGVAASATAQDKGPIYLAGENGVTPPVVVKEVKPHYPKAGLNAKKSAIVEVTCVVTRDGRTTSVKVAKQGDPAFDREAVKALRQWQFKPGMKDGQPVPVRIVVELTFTAK